MTIGSKRRLTAISFLILFAVVCFWYASRGVRWQNRIVSEINRRGGHVNFDYQYVAPDGRLDEDASPPGPLWIRWTIAMHQPLARGRR